MEQKCARNLGIEQLPLSSLKFDPRNPRRQRECIRRRVPFVGRDKHEEIHDAAGLVNG